jgi:competence ComEA-like helix-hairpin-helix protein
MDDKGAPPIEVIGSININEANVEDFLVLPGLGEKKAIAIVKYVKEKGPITRKKQLLNVPGVGESLLETISPNLKLKGKTNIRVVSVKEVPPTKISEMMEAIERKKEELKKTEKRLRKDGHEKTKGELVSMFEDLVGEIKDNMEKISDNVIRTTSTDLEKREKYLDEREKDLSRLEVDLAEKRRTIEEISPEGMKRDSELAERERIVAAREKEIEMIISGEREDLDQLRRALATREAEITNKENELEILKENLLKKEVEIIIDEAKYQEFTRKRDELDIREVELRAKEAEINSTWDQARGKLTSRTALVEEIERKEELLSAREEGLRQMELDLKREEQMSREDIIRKEVELMVREVEVEEVGRKQTEIALLEESLGRREETLAIWEENLRMRETSVISTTPMASAPLPSFEVMPEDGDWRDGRLNEREMNLRTRAEELERFAEELDRREMEMRRRSVELALKESEMEGLEERDAELRFKIKAFQERQNIFMTQVSSLIDEAKRIRTQLEEKKIDLMAREKVLRKMIEEGA